MIEHRQISVHHAVGDAVECFVGALTRGRGARLLDHAPACGLLGLFDRDEKIPPQKYVEIRHRE